MLLTTTIKPLLVIAMLLFLIDTAAACTCSGARQREGFHPCMTYWSADAVFAGLASEVSIVIPDVNGKPGRFGEKVVRFTVDDAFRGVQGATVEVVTNPSTPSCGYDFKQGQRYFVYATRRKSDGKLTEWLCGPTVPLDSAARDLAYAREVMSGENGLRIVGAVVKLERRHVRDYNPPVPMPGIEVTLEPRDHPGETPSKTVTNSDGAYEFRGLNPGGYRVRAALPPGSRELSPYETPKDHYVGLGPGGRCESDSFIVTTSSSIKGQLVTPDNSPPSQQYLALVPIDDNGKEISTSYSLGVNTARETGHYFFRDVPPGRYLLVVNPRNKPGKSDPVYPRLYYPGVMNQEQAKIITVPQSRELSIDDFTLTPPLKERWFSGVVQLTDGTPAIGAKVILIDPNDRMTGTNVTEVVADEQGRFRVQGYESFPYWIDAYIKLAHPNGHDMYAPPVKLATSGSVDGIKLVISLDSRAQPYH